ncbi:polyprenyl synthetase family protein [Nocardia sp. alder85J]|uniref:polyprenyl synthetase family protein n=1 Tax=Nocardia sp. alder85J TaxID=2862949 RepID=UPI001CD558C8|nr:polyprenyl synthetase family protein [Nocardia sp. alder85J]MCX4097555.1 polyprenyl synthetase family protein [Nocardia sp. alder85J]
MSTATADADFGASFPPEPRRGSSAQARLVLTRAQFLTKPLLRTAIDSLPGELRLMSGYHLGLWDEHGTETATGSGKGMRPALVLAATAAAGGTPETAVHAAAAIELVHNFTLIHDDVMDRDALRRGRPTVWRVWGIDNAILVGDAMHGLAVRTLAEAPVSSPQSVIQLTDSVIELCLGQQRDCAFETRQHITVDECLTTVQQKTSSLLGCACVLGALAASAPPPVVERMNWFGRELGVAFQLVDDLLGIWGDPARTGKPVGNDLIRRKRSLPVVAALTSATSAGRDLEALYRANHPLSPAEVARAADLIVAAGGKQWAHTESQRYLHSAIGPLLDHPAAADLLHLADAVVHRDR